MQCSFIKVVKFFQYKKNLPFIIIYIFIYKILFFACNIIPFKILYDFYFVSYNLFHDNINFVTLNIIYELKFNSAFNANRRKNNYYLFNGLS